MGKSDRDQWDTDNAKNVFGARTSTAIHQGMRAQDRLELSQVLNTRPDPIDQRDYIYKASLIDIPARFFNEKCTDLKFRVKEQGAEGTCVGQAIASLIEIQNLGRFEQGADVPQRVSARYLYSNAQLYDHHPDDSLEGSSLRGAIKGFYHNGACDEKLAQYRVQDDFKIKNAMWEDARRVALGTYFRLEHVLNHYHCALKESGSILCSAIIHDGWNNEAVHESEKHQRRGYIKYPNIITKRNGRGFDYKPSELSGGHAFVIVGYDATGFLVLNSWGNLWGRFPVDDLQCDEYKHPLGDETLSGIAHWSYDDWAKNVLDAWIIRLAAPTGHGTDFVGGRPKRTSQKDSGAGTARKRDVQGHYMHLRDGKLVEEPPYENDLGQFEDITTDLRTRHDHRHYRHVVLYAHGGLNTIDSASSRAAVMIPTFTEHGIYPIFYFWRTGFGQMLGSVIEGILPEIQKRSQDYTELKDAAIERLARPIGRAIWNDIRRNAAACFDKDYEDFCEKQEQKQSLLDGAVLSSSTVETNNAWSATRTLIEGCTRLSDGLNRPLKFHFIGHSAGVFLLGELFKRMEEEKMLNREWLGSVNLMVPCCRTSHFNDAILPICKHLKRKRLTVFNLLSLSERTMDPAMDPYGKSFASLVSNAFYDTKPVAISAMNDYWESDIKTEIKEKGYTAKVDYVRSGDVNADNEPKCSAAYHGEIDNDADTMNYILNKILNKKHDNRVTAAQGGFSHEQLKPRGF